MAYDPEQEIAKQYSQSRTLLRARQDAAKQNAMDDIARRENQSGFGGAGFKVRRKAMRDLESSFAGEEAGLGAEQARSVLGAKEAQTQREFATSERLGSEAFAGSEAEKARALQEKQLAMQEKQFGQTLDFQKGSFAEQMKYNWSEMDENKKTNFINAAIALKDAKLKTSADWSKLFSGLQGLYGSRVPDRYSPQTPENLNASRVDRQRRNRMADDLIRLGS